MDNEYQRGLAAGKLLGFEHRLDHIEAQLTTVVQWVNQQKGGKATMTAMLTTAGAFGAALAELVNWLMGGHR